MSYQHELGLPKRAGLRISYFSDLPSQTKTSFAEEADINVIVARFMKTGLLPTSVVPPTYMDTTAVPVGTDALMAIRAAQAAFETLPLGLRKELDHNPRLLEDWMRDPANRDAAIRYGLVTPKGEPSKQDLAGGAGPGQDLPVSDKKPVDNKEKSD